MHELSLAMEVLKIVECALQREGAARVAVLRLEAGALSGVEVAALRFALESLGPGTCLQGSRIEIDEPEGRGRCTACGADVPMRSRTEACPRCAAWGLQAVAGTALRVRDVLVSGEPPPEDQEELPCA